MSVDFLSKNFPPFQVHHAKKPPRFYPDGFQRNVIDFYFIFSDCRLRKALYLQFSYFIWPLGEQEQKDFIQLYGKILRLKNILSTFDQFAGSEILAERHFQDYQSMYIDLYQKFRPKDDGDKENINDDIEFEMELIRQVEINIDYILILVARYHDSNCTDKEILGAIDRAIDSSIQLRSKKDLIEGFIDTINASTEVDRDWHLYVHQQQETDLENIIEEERLKPDETRRFLANSFRDGALKTTGTDIDKLMPPVSRFGGGNRTEKKQGVIQRLSRFFEKYLGVA